MDALIVGSLQKLRGLLPAADLHLQQVNDAWRLELPFTPGAEYRLEAWFYEDGEREIGARLLALPDNEESETYFWHHPFELPDYGGSPGRLSASFDEELARILSAATRIRQRRGGCLWYFRMEYERAGKWERVYAHAGTRGAVSAPRIPGRERIYLAPPLLPQKAGG